MISANRNAVGDNNANSNVRTYRSATSSASVNANDRYNDHNNDNINNNNKINNETPGSSINNVS